MFVARIELQIQASQRETFRAYATGEGMRARELEGCVRYSFNEDVRNPLQVLLYEEWTSRAAFEAYKGSALFAEVGAHLGPLLEAPPSSAYYESENVFGHAQAAR